MATVVSATTVYKQTRGDTTRYRFRYVFDNGEIHERNAWVPSTNDEATERTFRQGLMLDELAEAESNSVIG